MSERADRVVIHASGKALHGDFSADREPVVTIEPGDAVRLSTLDSWWSAGPDQGGRFPERPRVAEYIEGAGHALTGPIAVRGARPGMTLEVRIDALVPAGWGTCVAGGWQSALNERYGIVDDGVIHTWTLDAEAMLARNQHGHTVALRPFLGVIGMPPPEPGQHSTIPPRRFGGNLDCRELVAGSTLFLPIGVDGGLLSVGDGHGVQGDGEVTGTAIERPMDRADLTVGLRDDIPIDGPVARTPAGWIALVPGGHAGRCRILGDGGHDRAARSAARLGPAHLDRAVQRSRGPAGHPDGQPGGGRARGSGAGCDPVGARAPAAGGRLRSSVVVPMAGGRR